MGIEYVIVNGEIAVKKECKQKIELVSFYCHNLVCWGTGYLRQKPILLGVMPNVFNIC